MLIAREKRGRRSSRRVDDSARILRNTSARLRGHHAIQRSLKRSMNKGRSVTKAEQLGFLSILESTLPRWTHQRGEQPYLHGGASRKFHRRSAQVVGGKACKTKGRGRARRRRNATQKASVDFQLGGGEIKKSPAQDGRGLQGRTSPATPGTWAWRRTENIAMSPFV